MNPGGEFFKRSSGHSMRVSDNRYSRDRLRLDLALRLIRHQARTQTIRAWTGLTDDRIRKLYRSYLDACGRSPCRPRGKSPRQSTFFTRSPQLREETTLLASLCCLLGVLPRGDAPAGTVPHGELVCQAFEVYHELVGAPRISFEHLVLLVTALAHGEELALQTCRGCGALIVVDRAGPACAHCSHCAADAPAHRSRAAAHRRRAGNQPPARAGDGGERVPRR
jgi:hypothetical protein